LPVCSYHTNDDERLGNDMSMYQSSGANAVKLEGIGCLEILRRAVLAGVPVVAHLGLTPQYVGVMGFKMQAGSLEEAEKLLADANKVQEAGACMLVLEAIPAELAENVTEALSMPTIGIGAGAGTDGQVLVYHDVLQYGSDRLPKFVKSYGDFNSAGTEGLAQYVKEVKSGAF